MNSTKAVESRLVIALQILQQTSTTRHPYHGSLLNPRRFRGIVRGRLQVVDDFLGENIGIGKIVRVLETLLSEPEDVEAGIVAIDEFVVIIIALENIAGQI